jgi:hypothetical protein
MWIFIIILIAPVFSFSQTLEFEPQGIPVEVEGRLLPIPWTGGMDDSKPEFVDIDGDGDYDCFIGDASGKLWYFENIGTNTEPEWEFVTDFYDSINVINYCAPSFCDINEDLDYDLFTIGHGLVGIYTKTIWYYENIGNFNTPSFLFITDTLLSAYACQSTDFGDIDNDGDYDLLRGYTGGGIRLYKNYGNATSFFFNGDTLLLMTSYYPDPEFCDIDNDSDLDIVYGLENGHVNLLRNDGTPQQYNFTVVTQNIVPPVAPDAAPTLVDIDGDGDLDMFVGTESPGCYGWPHNIYYFENVGTAQQYDFVEITDSYFDIDVGDFSVPRLVDIDSDGDLDLFCGSMTGAILYYENIGDTTAPSFQLQTEVFQGIVVWAYIAPEFVDLDRDGDKDLFIGYENSNNYGELKYYENIGTGATPIYQYDPSIAITGFPVGPVSPAVCDINGDGDYDLFLGTGSGTIMYYRNNGTAQNPVFQLDDPNYFDIDVGYDAKPFFYDIDDDGDYDLFIGAPAYEDSVVHNVYFYRNDGNAVLANFTFITANWCGLSTHSYTSSPCLADIDNNGNVDLFLGGSDGGIRFYRNYGDLLEAEVTISISGNDVVLHWGVIADTVEYHIYYQDTPYFTPSGIPQTVVMPPDTTWTDENVVIQGKRWYRVVVEY